MSDTAQNQVPVVKVAILGPSRIGKTSIISSLQVAARAALVGTDYLFSHRSPNTRLRINANNSDLDGAIRANYLESDSGRKSFASGSLAGTEEAFTFQFKLALEPEKPDSSLYIDILDFPGGWLDRVSHDGINAVKEHLNESALLIVPIDAIVLMEAATGRQRAAVPSILAVDAVKELANDWAKFRRVNNLPATLLFVPVKCEEYLRPTSLSKGKNNELFSRVVALHYQDMIKEVREENNQLQIAYTPVETIGSVSLKKTEWDLDGPIPNVHAEYTVVAPHKREVRGASDIIQQIAEHSLRPILAEAIAKHESKIHTLERRGDQVFSEKEKNSEKIRTAGLWSEFLNIFTGELDEAKRKKEDLEKLHIQLRSIVGEELEQLDQLLKQIEKLKSIKRTPHFKIISG